MAALTLPIDDLSLIDVEVSPALTPIFSRKCLEIRDFNLATHGWWLSTPRT